MSKSIDKINVNISVETEIVQTYPFCYDREKGILNICQLPTSNKEMQLWNAPDPEPVDELQCLIGIGTFIQSIKDEVDIMKQ